MTIDSKTAVTYNDPALTEKMLPSLQRVSGEKNVVLIDAQTGAEDFASFQKKVPGLYFFVGACPPEVKLSEAPSHHTPDFMMDEAGMLTGVKALLNVTLDYMYMK